MHIEEICNPSAGLSSIRRVEVSIRFDLDPAGELNKFAQRLESEACLKWLYRRRTHSMYAHDGLKHGNIATSYCVSDRVNVSDGLAVLSVKTRKPAPWGLFVRHELCVPVLYTCLAYVRSRPAVLSVRLRDGTEAWQTRNLWPEFSHLQLRWKWKLSIADFSHPVFVSLDGGKWASVVRANGIERQQNLSLGIEVNLPERPKDRDFARALVILEAEAKRWPRIFNAHRSDLTKIEQLRRGISESAVTCE